MLTVSSRPKRKVTFHAHDKLRAQKLCLFVDRRFEVCAEHHLSDSIAVPQINEDDASEVAALMYPPHQQDAGTGVRRTEFSASVRAPKFAKKIQWYLWFHISD